MPWRNCDFCLFLCRLLVVEPRIYGHLSAGDETYFKLPYAPGSKIRLMIGNSVRAVLQAKGNPDEGMDAAPPATIGSTPLSQRLVQAWLPECESTHSEHCHVNTAARDPVNTYFIDVNRLCLIPATTSQRYLALSYVVGEQKGLQLIQANLDSLLVCGALDETAGAGVGLTRVARDAIRLVRSLGEDLLWVDSLCIVQDDTTTKHNQIMNMDTIYSHALLTIVSVSGDSANHGLPGVQSGSRPEVTVSTRHRGVAVLAQPPALGDILAASPYETRGWTFQERILSSRCLYLTRWGAYFQCGDGLRSEIHDAGQGDPLIFSSPKARTARLGHFSSLTGDTFSSYSTLVLGYTQRRLSFASDILAAFSAFSRPWSADMARDLGDPVTTCTSEIELVTIPESRETGANTVLEFWATTADPSHFRFDLICHQPEASISKSRVSIINARAKSTKGHVFEYLDVVRSRPGSNAARRQLVLIARSAFPIYGDMLDGRDTGSIPILDSHRAGEACMVYFLLVEWKGEVAERVAVGMMHRVHWDAVPSERVLVRLV
ncbi:heterokaryon incompatibility protein-domain-containing protein [Staphylotrichum tortipilum]|uniref:Heterokaryon incompatibility protein-domain-containing protein n=1 Tax=Staphylotrichum tortipilum TaxID=2831512 RepID=A0AAN6MG93_9PEZI|nr:heterokaryon incompatibility protein-domain-containing protein [Staphylotrichum longicolle]